MPVKTYPQMTDITAPTTVSIDINSNGTTLWVNVDGICRLRICRIPHLTLDDNRPAFAAGNHPSNSTPTTLLDPAFLTHPQVK